MKSQYAGLTYYEIDSQRLLRKLLPHLKPFKWYIGEKGAAIRGFRWGRVKVHVSPMSTRNPRVWIFAIGHEDTVYREIRITPELHKQLLRRLAIAHYLPARQL